MTAANQTLQHGKGREAASLDSDRYMKSAEARRLLGYSVKNRGGFLAFLKNSGIPFVPLNARTFLIERAGLEDWLQRRTVGRPVRHVETAGLRPRILHQAETHESGRAA